MNAFLKHGLYFSAIWLIAALPCLAQSKVGQDQQPAIWNGFDEELKTILADQDYENRHYRLDFFARKLGEIELEKALCLGDLIKSPADRIVFLIRLMKMWGRRAPLEALHYAEASQDGESRMAVVNAALQGWAADAPLEALKWARDNLSNIYRRTAYAQIGEIWTRTAPGHAASWGLQLSNELERIFYTVEVLETWSEINPLDAAHWADALPPGKFHDLIISKVLKIWGEHYPKWAVEWLESSPQHSWLMPSTVAKWSQIDRSAALKWTQSLKDSQLADQCTEAIVLDWSEYNPKAAYLWSSANLKGEVLISCRKSILGAWTSDDPLEALQWAESLSSPQASLGAMDIILESWAASNLEDCRDWVIVQKNAAIKDMGISKLITVLADSEPSSAADLALLISDLKLRKSNLSSVVEKWKPLNPQESAAWFNQHPEVSKLLSQ